MPIYIYLPEDQGKLQFWEISQNFPKNFAPPLNSAQIQTQFAS
jgi:hypothetical protein